MIQKDEINSVRTMDLDFSHFDDIGVYSVGNRLEATGIASEAGLFAWFTLWATVTINAFRVITLQSEAARSHACNSRQDMKLLFGKFAIMVMIAVLFVGAFPKKEIIVAQFEFLQSVQVITRDALEIETIHPLSVFISFH